MKSIIAASIIGLLGLYATESHADAIYKRCAVMACENANSASESCEMDDNGHATITDFGSQFSVKYTQGDTLSPPLTVHTQGYMMGKVMNQGNEFLFMKADSGKSYAVIRTKTRVAFIFAKCEAIN